MCRNFGVIRFKTRHSKCRTGFIALQVFSEMFQHTQLRIVGYTAILVIHTTNVFYMNWHTKGVHTKDERVLVFKGLDNRFLTTWNFMLQTAYAIFGLLCDVYVLKNSRKQLCSLPNYIAELRETMFSAIVWPSTWLVFTVFWGLYNYDRSLIFPEYLDPFLPRVSNHVIHLTGLLAENRTQYPFKEFDNIEFIHRFLSVGDVIDLQRKECLALSSIWATLR
ncbi:unnamed protein product [Arctia plantaginis]|uniref:Uncharacterized protein n=1 Tax=Arctia plantaginis TaxID=874455 RepID=A0A8S1A199_ARCPL|nr:unnamed protein product [Arctia plantaginis]CAB3241704.1 unnamed protein product [Arctia plantaginis]